MIALDYVPFASQAELEKHERAEARAWLMRIKTRTGQSALDRMKACRFRIQWKTTWAEPVYIHNENLKLNPGDTSIQVYFDRPAADPQLAKDNLARWFVRGRTLQADTGWAREIQFGAYPINRDGLTRC